MGPQPLWLRNQNSGLAQRIMVKRLATSPHDPLGITDSACKNQSVVVSVQYGPFNPYIPIRSTTIGKSRVAIDPIAMHTSWRSNSDIASVTSIGYPRMSASGESSTTMHRLLHATGSHPIPTPYRLQMPPRREGGRRTRRSAEGSRAGSDDDAQVEDVTRQIGGMELVLARFQWMNPPTFAGTEGGSRAEAWFVQMEDLFDTLEYAPEKRLKLAVLQLRDDAVGDPDPPPG
ncbi:putative leucine-rich repeat receptor-like protein kinase [Dorcoceras hygrometricum]|uniref:Putative leucine-rich repeat receptor-like protein kinase n=1 Tax=Dorcoceras hygrometricum TaxID=472368 RepID=A0A2Z7AHS9_9LAMI|nr:putative leucine-rich repeat receptor-like protein kinase [Dorcoceras hygrometricum]